MLRKIYSQPFMPFRILIQKRSKKDFVQPEFVGLSKALASSDWCTWKIVLFQVHRDPWPPPKGPRNSVEETDGFSSAKLSPNKISQQTKGPTKYITAYFVEEIWGDSPPEMPRKKTRKIMGGTTNQPTADIAGFLHHQSSIMEGTHPLTFQKYGPWKVVERRRSIPFGFGKLGLWLQELLNKFQTR